MEEIEWSCFRQRINIAAPKEKLYNAFATRSGIESWFLRMSEYKHPGDSLLLNNEQVNKMTRINGYGLVMTMLPRKPVFF